MTESKQNVSPDWRGLCEELVLSWDAHGCDWRPQHQVVWNATVERARAILSQTNPEVPSVMEIVEWLRERATWCTVDDPAHEKYDRAADLLERQATAYSICDRGEYRQIRSNQ